MDEIRVTMNGDLGDISPRTFNSSLGVEVLDAGAYICAHAGKRRALTRCTTSPEELARRCMRARYNRAAIDFQLRFLARRKLSMAPEINIPRGC